MVVKAASFCMRIEQKALIFERNPFTTQEISKWSEVTIYKAISIKALRRKAVTRRFVGSHKLRFRCERVGRTQISSQRFVSRDPKFRRGARHLPESSTDHPHQRRRHSDFASIPWRVVADALACEDSGSRLTASWLSIKQSVDFACASSRGCARCIASPLATFGRRSAATRMPIAYASGSCRNTPQSRA